jgi:hypothetical protein
MSAKTTTVPVIVPLRRIGVTVRRTGRPSPF